MTNSSDYQTETRTGGQIWLKTLDLPYFPQSLLAFAIATKWSVIVDQTLQQSLTEGFALPIWGIGKNKIIAEARQFVKQIFNDGQKTRPAVASEVVTLMQEKKNILGQSMFDKDSFLDEDQIKSLFSAFSRGKKRALVDDEKEEEDNLEEKQDEEEDLEDQDLVENVVLATGAIEQVKTDLDHAMEDSDTHPITFDGLIYCNMAESILKKLSPLDKLTKEELRTIVAKIEAEEVLSQDLKGKRKRNKTLSRLASAIVAYVEDNCWCCAFQQ